MNEIRTLCWICKAPQGECMCKKTMRRVDRPIEIIKPERDKVIVIRLENGEWS